MDLIGSNGSKWISTNQRSCCEVGIKDFFDPVSIQKYFQKFMTITFYLIPLFQQSVITPMNIITGKLRMCQFFHLQAQREKLNILGFFMVSWYQKNVIQNNYYKCYFQLNLSWINLMANNYKLRLEIHLLAVG